MNPDAATFQRRFEDDYTKLFGRPVAGMDIEITVWSVNATTPPKPVTPVKVAKGGEAAEASGARQVFDAASGVFLETKLIERDTMQAGQTVAGPAALTEAETTIIVPASRRAICQPDGCIDVLTKEH